MPAPYVLAELSLLGGVGRANLLEMLGADPKGRRYAVPLGVRYKLQEKLVMKGVKSAEIPGKPGDSKELALFGQIALFY